MLTLQQPVVAPLYDTLQGEDVILRCLAELKHPAAATYQEFLKKRWQDEVQPKGSPIAFARFWNACLHDGLYQRGWPPLRRAASAAKRAPRPPRARPRPLQAISNWYSTWMRGSTTAAMPTTVGCKSFLIR